MVISDGLWHTVRWSQDVRQLTLVVDSALPVQGEIPGDFTSLDVHQNGTAFVHLGGLADFQQIPTEGEHASRCPTECLPYLLCYSRDLHLK